MDQKDKTFQMILKLEPYALGFFGLAFLLRLGHMPFSSEVFIISISALALIYVFKSSSKNDRLETFAQFIQKGIFNSIALGLIALLYQIQQWPFRKEMVIVFLGATSLMLLLSLVKKVPVKQLISMNNGILLLGLLFLIITSYFNLF